MSNFKCRFRVTSNKLKEFLKEKGSMYNITVEGNEVFFNDVQDLKNMLANVVESNLKRTNFSSVTSKGQLEKIGVIKDVAGKRTVDIKPEHLTPEFIDTLDLRTPGSIRKEFLNALTSYRNMFLGKSPKGKLTKEELAVKLETMLLNLDNYSTGDNAILNAAQRTEILLDINGLKEFAQISESDNKYRPNNLPIVQFLYNGVDEVQNFYETPDRIIHTPEQYAILTNLIQQTGRSFTKDGTKYNLSNNGTDSTVDEDELYVAKTKFELKGKNVNQVLIGSNPFSNIIPPVTDAGRIAAAKVLSELSEDEIKEKLVVRLTNTSAVTANNEVRLAYGQIETFETAQQQAHLQAGGNALVVKHRMQDFDALLIINHEGKDVLIGHIERLNYAKVGSDNSRIRLSPEELAEEVSDGSLFDYMSNEDRDNPTLTNLKDNEHLKTSMLQDLELASKINEKVAELYEQHGNSDFKYSDVVNIKKAVFTLDFNKDGISPTSEKLKDSLDSAGQPFIVYEGKLINGNPLEFDKRIQASGLNVPDFLADKFKGTLQQVIFHNGVHKAPVTGNKLTFSDPALKSTINSIFTPFEKEAQDKTSEQLANAVKSGLNNKLPFGFYGNDGKFWTISISPYFDHGKYQLAATSFTNNISEEKYMAFTDPLVGFLKLAKELGATQAQYITDARNGKLDLTNFATRISENIVKNTLKVSIIDGSGKELNQPDDFDVLEDYNDDDMDYELLQEANKLNPILLDGVEERLSKILPAEFSVIKTTSDAIKSASMTSTPIAAFFKKVIYLTNKASKGTEYHEAYHALEKHVLSKEEVSALHAFASSITYSDSFASERGLGHLSSQQLQYKQRQEHIADTFKTYMNDRTGSSLPELVRSVFNKILDFLKYITGNQSKIESIFYRIRKGQYVNKPVREEQQEDYEYEVLKYKQSTKDGIVEVVSTSNQRNNIISYVAIRVKQTGKRDDLKQHVQHYLDKYAEAFENIKNTLNEDKTKTNKTLKGEDRTNALTFYQNYRLVKEVGPEAVATNVEKEVTERLKNVGQVYSFNDEVEFDESGVPIVQEETTVVEETGRASFDTSNLALNPEDKLSKALKSWISFANNTITIGNYTVFKAVDQTRIYNALLKALSGQKRDDIFDTLEAYSKFDKDLEIFWNYAKQEFGASFDGTKWVPSIISQQLEQFYNGFQVAHFSYVDTVQDSKGTFYNVNAAYQDFITKGTAEWENYYTQKIQDLLKTSLTPDPKTGKTRKDKISALRQLLDFGERALNGITTDVDNSIDRFHQGLSQYIPISKGYLTYAIYDKNRDKLTDRQARILKYLENNGNRIPFDTTIFDNLRHLNDSLTKEIAYVPNLFRDQPVQATGIEASTKMVKLVEADYYAQFGAVPLSIRTPDGKARYSIARQSFLVERFNQTKDVEFRRSLKDNPLSDEKYDSILSGNQLIVSNGIRLSNSEAKTWGENNGIEYGYHTMSLFIDSIVKSNYTKMQCVLAQHETSNTNTLIELPYENLFSLESAKDHFKKMFLYECKQVINGTIRANENNRLLLEDPSKRKWSNLLQSKADFDKGLPVNISKARAAQFWFFKNLLENTDSIYSKVRAATSTEIDSLEDRPEVTKLLEEIFEEAFVGIDKNLSQDINTMLVRRSNDFNNDEDQTWMYAANKDKFERRLANEFYSEDIIPMPELPELELNGLSKEEIKSLKETRKEELKALKKQNKADNAKAQLQNLFVSSYLNTTIQTYWYHQMYFGSLQSFKDGLDQTKRMKLLNVSGSTLVGGKFEMIEEPVEATTNPNFTDGKPRNIEHADGQIYGPVFQKLLYQKRLGRMSETVRDIYIDTILGFKGTEKSRKALENENCTLESTKVTIVAANKDDYGQEYIEYIKCSQTWMVRADTSYYNAEDADKVAALQTEIGNLLRTYVGNEPFDKEELESQLQSKFKEYHQYWHPLPSGKFGHDMLNKMESNLIGFMIPPSASKAFQKQSGTFSDSQVRLQVETHSTETQITKGTQAYEVINSEIDPNEPVRINGVDTTLGEIQQSWRQSLANTLNNDVTLISNLFDTESAQAKARALASGDMKAYEEAIAGSKIDMNLLSAKMMNSLEASSAADKIIDWFKMVDGKPEYLWDAALTLDKFQQQLLAEFSKNIFSKKTAGSGLIIVSPTNYKVLETQDGIVIPSNRQEGYIQTGDNTWKKEGFREAILRPLKITTTTDSLGREVEEIECVVPKKFAHDFQLGKIYAPSKLGKLYGYRIPTEDKRSIQVLKIVDYVDPLLGDIIIMAKEAQIKSGHDYDVDKQYTEFPRLFKFEDKWYTYNDYVTIEDKEEANRVKWAGYYDYITTQKPFIVLKNTLKKQAYNIHTIPISIDGDIIEIDSNDETTFNEAVLAHMGFPATLEQLNKAEATLGHTLNVYKQQQDQLDLQRVIVQSQSFETLNNDETSTTETEKWAQHAEDNIQERYKIQSTKVINSMSDWGKQQRYVAFVLAKKSLGIAAQSAKVNNWLSRGFMDLKPEVQFGFKYGDESEQYVSITQMGPNFINKLGKLVPHPDYKYDRWLEFQTKVMQFQVGLGLKLPIPTEIRRTGANLGEQVSAVADNGKLGVADSLNMNPQMIGLRSMMFQLHIPAPIVNTIMTHPATYKLAAYLATTGGKVGDRNMYFNAFGEFEGVPDFLTLEDLLEPTDVSELAVTKLLKKLYDLSDSLISIQAPLSLTKGLAPTLPDMVKIDKFISEFDLEDIHGKVSIKTWKKPPINLKQFKSIYTSDPYVTNLVNKWMSIRKLIERSNLFLAYSDATQNAMKSISERVQNFNAIKFFEDIPKYTYAKAYYDKLPEPQVTDTELLLAGHPTNLVNQHAALKAFFKDNLFLNSIGPKRSYGLRKSEKLLAEMNAITSQKKNPEFMERIEDDIESLLASNASFTIDDYTFTTQDFFDNIIRYELTLNGLSFVQGTMLSLIPNYMLKEYSDIGKTARLTNDVIETMFYYQQAKDAKIISSKAFGVDEARPGIFSIVKDKFKVDKDTYMYPQYIRDNSMAMYLKISNTTEEGFYKRIPSPISNKFGGVLPRATLDILALGNLGVSYEWIFDKGSKTSVVGIKVKDSITTISHEDIESWPSVVKAIIAMEKTREENKDNYKAAKKQYNKRDKGTPTEAQYESGDNLLYTEIEDSKQLGIPSPEIAENTEDQIPKCIEEL